MPAYTLKLSVNEQGLKNIHASGQKVTVVKSIDSGHEVAWLLFDPFMQNMIIWEDAYSVYASPNAIEAGATIVAESIKAASDGNIYDFENGSFSAGVPSPDQTDYIVKNNDSNIMINGTSMITSGLYQRASVNGSDTAAPLNAASILFNETALFTPSETIKVFLSSYSNSGTVISSLTSDGVIGSALTVTYTDNLAANIIFNDATNTFEMA